MKDLNRGKQISPIVFYGTPRGVPPKKPLSLLRLLCEIRNDLSEHSNSNVRYWYESTGPLFALYQIQLVSTANINITVFPVFTYMTKSWLLFLLSKEVWATFPRQNEAMNFAKGHSDSRIFSYQNHYNGRRRFLVSTYKEFWRRCSVLYISSTLICLNVD